MVYTAITEVSSCYCISLTDTPFTFRKTSKTSLIRYVHSSQKHYTVSQRPGFGFGGDGEGQVREELKGI